MFVQLTKLTWREFEDLIEDLFLVQGYNVDYRSGVGPDGGRDIVVSQTCPVGMTRATQTYVIQCKRYDKTVSADQVLDISDTIVRYNANGYVLAVASDVSEPLQKKLTELSETRGWTCRIYRPTDIYRLLISHEEIFQKYFAQEYEEFRKRDIGLTLSDIKRAALEVFGLELIDDDAKQLRINAIVVEISDFAELEHIYRDQTLRGVVDNTYERLLKRKPSDYEFMIHAALVSRYSQDTRQLSFDFNISQSLEFISRARLIASWDIIPRGRLQFSRVGQVAFGCQAYHDLYKDGTMEIGNSEVAGYTSVLTFSSSTERDFRLWLSAQLPEKKRVIVDYQFQGTLQFFCLVSGSDGGNYFLQYIEGAGQDFILDDRGTKYVRIHGLGVPNGSLLRREMEIDTDLKNAVGCGVTRLDAFIVGITGRVALYRLVYC
jgi:hypothetical protein